MAKRNLYLKVLPAEEALELYLNSIKEDILPKTEVIPVVSALGRKLFMPFMQNTILRCIIPRLWTGLPLFPKKQKMPVILSLLY